MDIELKRDENNKITIPKEVVDRFKTRDYKAIQFGVAMLLFPKDEDCKLVLQSIDIIKKDIKLRLDIQKKSDLNNFNYKLADINTLKDWLSRSSNKYVKYAVSTDYREFNSDEIKDLSEAGCSKSKLIALYGHRRYWYPYMKK